MSSYDDDIKKFDEALANLDLIKSDVKQLKKNYISNLKKKGSKTKNSDSTEPKKCYGITEPKVLPPNIYEFIKFLFEKNVKVTINHTIDRDTAEYIVGSFGHKVVKDNQIDDELSKLKKSKIFFKFFIEIVPIKSRRL